MTEAVKMTIAEKLMLIQQDLKAPKGQYNSFGKYKYRSCEDILEAVKPLLGSAKAALTVTDDLVLIGDRYYIKATAVIHDTESGESISNSAYAREPADKKGMDESQVTGTASSYARKYALNGLFCIDDTKDADTEEYQGGQPEGSPRRASAKPARASSAKSQGNPQAKQPEPPQATQQAPQQPQPAPQPALDPPRSGAQLVGDAHVAALRKEMERTGVEEGVVLGMANVGDLSQITMAVFKSLMNKFSKTPDRAA